MKRRRSFSIILAVLVLGATAISNLSAIVITSTSTPNLNIPDNNLAGAADTLNISTPIISISQVKVTLNITGTPAVTDAYNGDFYAYLTHGTGFAVLLNRTGSTVSNPFGYSDSGFSVTFDDTATNGDIHNYENTVNPNGGALAGIWQPDGRNVNPSLSLDTTARTALLNSFNGLDPNGQWTLFVADVSPTGTGRIASWGVEITGQAVPEPATVAFGFGCIGVLLVPGRIRAFYTK